MRMPQIDHTDGKMVYPDLSYKICGFLFCVHNELGRYRNEKQYGDFLEEVLKKNQISYDREKELLPSFDGEVERRNIVDFIIEDKIVLELKAKPFIGKEDYFQTKRYLISSGKKLGIIVNFRQKFLNPKRVLNSNL